MSVPTATISSPTRAGDAAQRAAARVAVDRADVADARPSPSGERRRVERRAPRAPRGRGPGRTRRRVASYSCAGRVLDGRRRPRPRRRARSSRRGRGVATQPLPSWIWRHARPLTFTIDARTRRVDRGRDRGVGRRPGIGRRRRAGRAPTGTARRRSRGPTPRTAPAASAPSRSIARDDRRAARHARGPALRRRERRDDHPHEHEHAERADRRARDAVPARQRRAQRRRRGARARRAPRPSAWPSVATSTRNSTATVTRSSALVPPNAVTTRGTKWTPIDEPDRDAGPRERRARRSRGASRRSPAPSDEPRRRRGRARSRRARPLTCPAPAGGRG